MSGFRDPVSDEDRDGSETIPILWRQINPRLWAGRLEGRPAGTIEQGRDFVFVDLEGGRHSGYRTLDDAKIAAMGPTRQLRVGPADRSMQRLLVGLAVTVVVVATVLVVVWAVLRNELIG